MSSGSSSVSSAGCSSVSSGGCGSSSVSSSMIIGSFGSVSDGSSVIGLGFVPPDPSGSSGPVED